MCRHIKLYLYLYTYLCIYLWCYLVKTCMKDIKKRVPWKQRQVREETEFCVSFNLCFTSLTSLHPGSQDIKALFVRRISLKVVWGSEFFLIFLYSFENSVKFRTLWYNEKTPVKVASQFLHRNIVFTWFSFESRETAFFFFY